MTENEPLPPSAEKKTLSLSAIRTDGGTQARDRLDDDVVEEYAAAIAAGQKLPPLKVVWDGSRFWLWDGFHTWTAAGKAGKRSWPCEVWHGNVSLARVLAASANQGHGLRRSNSAKRRAAEMLLAERPAWSSRAIAEHCGVSHTLVDKVRAEAAQVATVATSPEPRVGRDGKSYPASPGRKPEGEEAEAAPIGQPEPFDLPATEPPAADSPAGSRHDPDEAMKAPESMEKPDDPEPDPTSPTPAAALPVPDPASERARPGGVRDEAGLLIPEALLPTWNARERFAGIISLLRKAQSHISDLGQSAGGEALRAYLELHERDGRQTLKLDRISSAIRQIESAQPHAMTCPYCHAKGTAGRCRRARRAGVGAG
jgi:hypothetical protein